MAHRVLDSAWRHGGFPASITDMHFCLNQSGQNQSRKPEAAFTRIEILITIIILTTVLSGLICGYVQANWTAEWSSMSLAAQSAASEGAEQVRAANWRPRDWPVTNGPQTMDEIPSGYTGSHVDYMDIPTKGNPASTNFQFWVTNFVSVTNISVNPPLRQITSFCVWAFPLNNRLYTNTVILIRASDQ